MEGTQGNGGGGDPDQDRPLRLFGARFMSTPASPSASQFARSILLYMSERDGSSSTNPDQKELPPIPDGGLGKGLPSWLEAPPSRPWKPTGEPTPIDLDALGADVQLPTWLQDLSGRVGRGETTPDDVKEDDATQEQAIAEPAERLDTTEIKPEPVPESPVVVAPPAEAKPDEPTHPVVTPEPRQIGVYVLYALAVIVVAALAAWLIWA